MTGIADLSPPEQFKQSLHASAEAFHDVCRDRQKLIAYASTDAGRAQLRALQGDARQWARTLSDAMRTFNAADAAIGKALKKSGSKRFGVQA